MVPGAAVTIRAPYVDGCHGRLIERTKIWGQPGWVVELEGQRLATLRRSRCRDHLLDPRPET
jgi:hypothetical protein